MNTWGKPMGEDQSGKGWNQKEKITAQRGRDMNTGWEEAPQRFSWSMLDRTPPDLRVDVAPEAGVTLLMVMTLPALWVRESRTRCCFATRSSDATLPEPGSGTKGELSCCCC